MRTYITAQGDMWDQIAYKELGSVYYIDELIQANMKHHEYFKFPAGIELVIPDVITASTPDTLPPWKR